MSDEKSHTDDEMWKEAMAELSWALDEGYSPQRSEAIDNLISVRLTIMMEEIADRLQKGEME